jgi:hypothetical protein
MLQSSVQQRLKSVHEFHGLSVVETGYDTASSTRASSTLENAKLFDIPTVSNSKRIFRGAKDPYEIERFTTKLGIKYPSGTMANRLPVLTTSNLPAASPSESQNTASPARGSAMLNSIFKSVRVPEFRFKWQFWAEKGQQQSSAPKDRSATTGAEEYASRPKPLGEVIISIKEFYQHFNNIPTDQLKLRDSIHLFHHGVKPLWEDPRNARGGAWYFRVNKEVAPQIWHEICLLAVGDMLQGAVETKREGASISESHSGFLLIIESIQRRHMWSYVLRPLECGSDRCVEQGCR